MSNYEEFLAGLNREAYHEGEFSWEEDGFQCYRMHPWSPPGCHDACGSILYMKDGKLDHVEGDPLSPYNNGKLCMRCLDLPEATNNPMRIRYPMRRIGERGSNKWERITWDEALDTVVQKIGYFRDTFGIQSIAVSRGTGRDVSWGAGFLAYVGIQTPHHDILFNIGWSCYTPRMLASNVICGDDFIADASETAEERYANPQWRTPGVILVWANEPLKSNGDGFLGHWLVECVQLGSKVVSIDPRLTWWAVHAEYWIQLKPGTDAALAMALINVIVSEDIYNHDFVERWCYGFDEMAKAVEGMTPEEAGRICDVDPEVIRQVARLFATESPGTVQWGLSLEQNPGSMGANIGILDLLAICGYIDCPGGAILVRDAYGLPHHVGEGYCPPENLALRCQKPGPGAIWGETRQMYWDWEKHEVARIRMLIIESCNTLANTAGDAPRIFDDMKELDFVVGIEPFLSPTITAFADIVLPVSMSIERDSIRAWWTPLRFTAKIAQYYEAKSDEDIAIEITNRLYPDRLDDIKSAKDLQNWRLSGRDELRSTGASIDEAKGNAGGTFSILQNAQVFSNERWDDRIDFDGFKKLGYSYDNFNATYYKYEKGMLRDDLQPGFKTTTGRIELYSLSYRAWGIPPVPDFVSPEIDASQEYPLIMTSGVRSWEFFHSEHRQLPTMREFHPWPQVMMNENVAREFGVREGAWVWIANEQGRFMQKAHIVPNGFLKDNNITVEHGWWYPEDDPAEPVLCRTFDSNPNNCIDIDRVGPYGIGSYTKCTPVTLYPVKEDDVTPTQQIVEMGGFPPQKARKIARESDWEARGVVSN